MNILDPERKDKLIQNLLLIIALLAAGILALIYIYVSSLEPVAAMSRASRARELLFQLIPNAIVALITVVVLFVLYRSGLTSEQRLRAMIRHSSDVDDIRDGLHKLRSELLRKKFVPDIIISFTRSASILAGMLATDHKLAVRHLLTIPRSVDYRDRAPQRYIFGEVIESLNPAYFIGKKMLIVFFHIDTGEGLRTGLEFLERQGVDLEKVHIQVCTLFVTPRAIQRQRNIIFAIEDAAARERLKQMFWVLGEYDYL
jgi:hypoxanthine phosphoribosyltransferase